MLLTGPAERVLADSDLLVLLLEGVFIIHCKSSSGLYG